MNCSRASFTFHSASPCGTCGGQIVPGTGLSSSTSAFPYRRGSTVASCSSVNRRYEILAFESVFNPLTPNDPYSGRTAPLTSKVAFYIFIQQI